MIWLARHGETAANAEGRVQGWIDPPLNERGREQARALGKGLDASSCAALYSSHLKRARETAEIVAPFISCGVEVDERFAESMRGRWEGRRLADIQREEPEAWAAWQRTDPDFRFPGGESLAEHVERVGSALDDVAAGPQHALVVCHGGTVRAALVARGGHRIEEFQRIAVPNGALFELGAS